MSVPWHTASAAPNLAAKVGTFGARRWLLRGLGCGLQCSRRVGRREQTTQSCADYIQKAQGLLERTI